jgi:aminoglycoside 3-N-acetyltransferase
VIPVTEPWESEGKLVEATKEPIVKKRLIEDLRNAGINTGDTVMFHSSMKSIGWIVGSSVTVISALMEAVSDKGTLVMPTQSGDNGEPSNWSRPAVPEDWWQIIRDETPPFDSETTPTRGMGRIPETFRKYPNVFRSNHPTASFGAWGTNAQFVVETHPYDDPFGENSPLAKLYQLNAKILLVGIGLESITSLHYAEYLANLPNRPEENRAAAILENGKRVWRTWIEPEFSDSDFHKIAADFEEKEDLSPVYIGQAESHIFSMKELVDYGVGWLKKNRRYEKTDST